VTELKGKWDYRDQSGGFSLGISLPGDAVSALLDADLIPEPDCGRNDCDDLRWMSGHDWIATHKFALDSGDSHHLSATLTIAFSYR
jgi:beta-mannosidase